MVNPELLLIRGTSRTKISKKIEVSIVGQPVRIVERLRSLGFQLQQNGKATYTVQVLRGQYRQRAHLIHRVTNKHRSLRERDTLKVI